MKFGDKIYGWTESQLSIARRYGGISIQGIPYYIDITDPEMPLVRVGVKPYAANIKAEKQKANREQAGNAEKAQRVMW